MFSVEFLDQVGAKSAETRFHIEFGENLPISVRELISARVKEEYSRRNPKEDDPVRAMIYGNVESLTDVKIAIQRAIEGFTKRRYLLLVDGKQLSALEHVFHPTTEMKVKFLRITPLQGG
jgi:hypothetical protein